MPWARVIRLAASAAALPALLSGCAGGSSGASSPTPGAAPGPIPATVTHEAAACLALDSSAAPAGTLHVVIAEHPMPAEQLTDCTGAPLALVTPAPDAAPVDSFAPARGTDLRDLLDHGLPTPGAPAVDVLVTRDPDVLSYAAQRGGYESVPLDWDRTYLLVAPQLDSIPPLPTVAERDALARDAVQADARGARPPFWWQTDSACATGPGRYSGGAPRVIGYPADDPIAQQLAERIVALAATATPPGWLPASMSPSVGGAPRTAGFAPTALNNALASGQIAGFVAGYAHQRPANCNGPIRIPAQASIVPLVDSRAHALVRLGSGAAFYVEGDGSVRFVRGRMP